MRLFDVTKENSYFFPVYMNFSEFEHLLHSSFEQDKQGKEP